MSNEAITELLSGHVRAISMQSFCESCFMDIVLLQPKDAKCAVTTETFQVFWYLGCGGREMETPFISRTMSGCCPTGLSSMWQWAEEIADLRTFIDLYSLPCENCSAKKVRMSDTGQDTGSLFLSEHQRPHWAQETFMFWRLSSWRCCRGVR